MLHPQDHIPLLLHGLWQKFLPGIFVSPSCNLFLYTQSHAPVVSRVDALTGSLEHIANLHGCYTLSALSLTNIPSLTPTP